MKNLIPAMRAILAEVDDVARDDQATNQGDIEVRWDKMNEPARLRFLGPMFRYKNFQAVGDAMARKKWADLSENQRGFVSDLMIKK